MMYCLAPKRGESIEFIKNTIDINPHIAVNFYLV